MTYARDRLALDPGWRHCPACDGAGDFTPDRATGLCPDCARRLRALSSLARRLRANAASMAHADAAADVRAAADILDALADWASAAPASPVGQAALGRERGA